jgi:hypothetical protein
LEALSSFTGFTSLVEWRLVCLLVAACLGAWLAFLGHAGDLRGLALEFAGLKVAPPVQFDLNELKFLQNIKPLYLTQID